MDRWNGEKIYWEINIPLQKNTVILKDLGIILGIPFILLTVPLLFISEGIPATNIIPHMPVYITILFFLVFSFIMGMSRGRYAAGYIIDKNGILNYTLRKHSEKNRLANFLKFIMVIASGRPYNARVVFMAQTRHSVFVKWQGIRKVNVYPETRTIVVKGGFADKVALFCNEDNFIAVRDIVLSRSSLNCE